MLDRTDFASWQQRIQLYCQGKVNGVNILKSIDEGPSQMGTIRDPIAEGTEGAQQLGLPKGIYTLINHYTEAKDIWDHVKMLLEAVKLNRGLRDSNYDQLYAYLKQHEAHANENKMMLDRFTQHTVDPLSLMSNVSQQQYYSRSSTTPLSIHLQPYYTAVDEDVDEQPIQDLALNVDNVFQADDYDTFDYDVDEAPTT
ncbi:hypothetical protein Tco_0542221 [Tanacetum coccineum]